MANRYSVATGLWTSTSVWSSAPGGSAGATVPSSSDYAYIQTGTVTVSSAIQVTRIYLEGGTLYQQATIRFSDVNGAGLYLNDDTGGSWTSNGTASSPKNIESVTAPTPSYPWIIRVEDQTTIPDDRSLDFDFVQFSGNKWYLGNDDYYIDFNGSSNTDPYIEVTTPLVREPKIKENYCEGRETGRVYQTGTYSGTLTVSGYVYWDTFDFITLKDMISSKERISFFGGYQHLPLCRIERCNFSPTPGNPIIPFSITLIEDI